MRLIYSNLKAWAIAIFILNFTNCKKFVTIEPPITQLVTASVFNNDGAITSAQVAIYTQMSKESFSMSQNTGLLGDELRNYSGGGSSLPFYTNSLTAGLSPGPWQGAYSYIHQATAIIEGLEKTNGSSEAIKTQIMGESKFIRAFWYFYLTNIYGDVPLATTTDYSVNANLSRATRIKVYEQIEKDLKEAQGLLNSDYVDASDTTISPERIRPTKWAATALLARVYLYTQKYDSAQLEATKVINNTTLYQLVTDLNGVFLMNSNEAIWQLAIPQPNTYNTYDGNQYILIGRPNTAGISSQLLDAFEPGDLRKANWISSITTSSPTATYYFPYKYKVRNVPDISEYVMVLRLAEQYLIRAEARAQQGDLPNAISDVDTIRNRAGLPDYSGPMNKDSVLASIFHERQVELFTEWGHRWFDMIRTGAVNSIMGEPGNVCKAKGGTWKTNGYQTLYPIWLSEMGKDNNLTQNAGY